MPADAPADEADDEPDFAMNEWYTMGKPMLQIMDTAASTIAMTANALLFFFSFVLAGRLETS